MRKTSDTQGETDECILIVGPSWVGDMVMAQALFKVLKQTRPGCHIDVLAPPWSRPLLDRMPEVAGAIDMPLAHGELGLAKRWRLGRFLKGRQYDQVIVLPNSFKSALVPLFSGIPLRTGWRGEKRGWVLNDCRDLDKSALPLMVQRFTALGVSATTTVPDPTPVPGLKVDHERVAQVAGKFSISAHNGNILALCPGAEFGEAKQWPDHYYAAVAESYLQNNENARVVLFGSAKDRSVCQKIVDQVSFSSGMSASSGPCLNLAGETTLAEAVDLLSLATVVVSNDSGLMHIAASLHRPLVAIYGSTSSDFTPPLSDRVEMLATDIVCRPCFKRTCPLQHKRCLTEITPDQVLSAIERLQQPQIASNGAASIAIVDC
ncbi:lipopolysaccharide heptosyltransferase II [Pseudohongiella nitratireducens]|uniref:lipopolysaccharide heptosyltransferase II n=1 Tax=Pseudohongiella nitratireducens TaxID=1768907 RepID=A0A917GMN3_9GAMM|nr:lipopolysaccharide heptosyltransferase II [Pseudohongiella nitratireducens]GGG51168.1 lipopolysaccharide heptosyltransferase II [Pseudohongiella nitratireducens]